ncbi:MAG: dnaE [Haloplasmataceae bacterium]|nr:dnaE [Haloplasmataceae bacterium]
MEIRGDKMYTQLYTKTVYSLLKSSLKIEDYVKQAKQYNMKSLAITDEINVYGVFKFYQECLKNDIKPIIGIHVIVEDSPLVLIAKSNIGYKNILKIASLVQLDEHKLLSFDKLKENSLDLICIIITQNNAFESLLLNNRFDLIKNKLNKFVGLFNDDLYLSIFPEVTQQIASVNQKVAYITSLIKIKIVAINEVKYLNKEDHITLRYLEGIDKGEKINTNTINLFPSNNYFLDNEQFFSSFNIYEEAVKNTNGIADSCNVTIIFNELHLPKYRINEDVTSDEYLKLLCKKGLEKRLGTENIPLNYLERLKYELNVINNMNFNDYFLIVYDFVKYAKRHHISVGPGRGSAAGSLVSFVLGITNVDPIKYELLFERFLNPERISMPDIDLDFQDDRRDEVIKYVQSKYGTNHVAHILTFGTFAARSAIREVSKVMEISDTRINEIIDNINANLSIEENIKDSQELQKIQEEFSEIKKLFTIAQAIEGIPRNTSTHAAGIIICDEDLSEISGLQPSIDEVLQTQFEAKDLETLGLLKMDFLGLRNLTAITEILSLIKNIYNIDIDLNNIPLNDAKTYRLIARGETTGLFQLESEGMRNVLRDINVSEFDDIVAVNALYRPGPMENIPHFIARKNKKEKIEYLHKDLIPILESTYGIIVYQEQIMQIAQKIANYSLGKADLLRRAVSKKQKDVLIREGEVFIQSAIKNGYDKNTASELYEYIVKFGDYGFNKSHSVAYALVSYQMAYLKANYLTPFMVILLSNVLGSESQTYKYIKDCKRYGIKILPLSINKSYNNYVIENHNIRISFLVIKGIGYSTSEAILKERGQGIFKNYFDFIYRTKNILKRNTFEALVMSGALDEFILTKKTMIENYDKVYDLSRFNQSGYFTDKLDYDHAEEEYTLGELMKHEKSLLGFYLTTHPIRKYLDEMKENPYILPSQTLKYVDQNIELIGFIENIKPTITKNKEEMASLIISDDLTSINAVIFPKSYQLLKNSLMIDRLFVIKCKVQERNNKLQLIINNLHLL